MLINLIFKLFLCYLIEKDYQALIHLYINIKKKNGEGLLFFLYVYKEKNDFVAQRDHHVNSHEILERERERN